MEPNDSTARVREWEGYGKGQRRFFRPRWSNIAQYTSAAYDGHVKRMLADNFQAGERVLDIGCGDGQWVEHLLSHGVNCVGVDLLRPSASTTAARGVRVTGRRLAVVADAAHLPFKAGLFNGIISFGLIEHFVEHERVLRQWKDLLGAGGRAILSVPNARRKDWMVYTVLHELVVHHRLLHPRTTRRGLVSRSYGYEERWTRAYFGQLCQRVGFAHVSVEGLFTLLPVLFHPFGDRIPPLLFRLLASPRSSRDWGLYLFAVAGL